MKHLSETFFYYDKQPQMKKLQSNLSNYNSYSGNYVEKFAKFKLILALKILSTEISVLPV